MVKIKDKDFPAIKSTILSESEVKGNCENFFGAIQVPLGIAGPLRIDFQKNEMKRFKKNYTVPVATTEGALVASINRGFKATYLSNGIKTYFENVGVSRGPVFRVRNIQEGKKILTYIQNNFSSFKEIAKKESNHTKLLRADSQIVGKNVWTRFYFDTCEAMGMNMATFVTEKIVFKIQNDTKIKCTALSGNFCSDKKPSWSSFIIGRGKKIWAEAVIKKDVVRKVLKTDSQKIVNIIRQKSHLGSIITGSLGFNAHFANIIAALYLATGQDLGHISEGSMGITDADVEKNGDLYFSIFLPDILVGTVGGGTMLPTQKEALKILGISNESGDSVVLAQIIGASVLAGELSLTAALASEDLAKAHKKLGRKN